MQQNFGFFYHFSINDGWNKSRKKLNETLINKYVHAIYVYPRHTNAIYYRLRSLSMDEK